MGSICDPRQPDGSRGNWWQLLLFVAALRFFALVLSSGRVDSDVASSAEWWQTMCAIVGV